MLCDKGKCEFLTAANARIAELTENQLSPLELAKLYCKLKELEKRAEQAEASCAAMKESLEEIRGPLQCNNCELFEIFPPDSGEKIWRRCEENPCDMQDEHGYCKKWKPKALTESETAHKTLLKLSEAGTSLLEENRRMREALTEIANHNPETKREALWSVELAKMALKGGA